MRLVKHNKKSVVSKKKQAVKVKKGSANPGNSKKQNPKKMPRISSQKPSYTSGKDEDFFKWR